MVVNHSLGKAGWSTVVVNGTHRILNRNFHGRSISKTFSRKIGSKVIQAKRPGTRRNSGNSVWEFWSTFEEIPFSRENFLSGRQN